MDKEIWSDIKGFEGKYQVSNLGNVKSLNYKRTGKEKILKPRKASNGYLQVCLVKEGKREMYTVHRLVLSTFNPCENSHELQVNHIDENKTNNNLSNLEWCTHKDNQNHGTRNKRIAEKNSIPIAQLALDGKYVKAWKSAHDAERECGFNNGSIIQCCKNKYMREGNNIYKDYRWMYLSEFLDRHNSIID